MNDERELLLRPEKEAAWHLLGIDINEIMEEKGLTNLMLAILRTKGEVAVDLILKGADVNVKDNGGNTALILAALMGQRDVVELLLDKGAYVNVSSHYGVTALVGASYTGQKDVVE